MMQTAPLPSPSLLCIMTPVIHNQNLVYEWVALLLFCYVFFCTFQLLLLSDEVKPDLIHATGGWTCLPLVPKGVHS